MSSFYTLLGLGVGVASYAVLYQHSNLPQMNEQFQLLLLVAMAVIPAVIARVLTFVLNILMVLFLSLAVVGATIFGMILCFR